MKISLVIPLVIAVSGCTSMSQQNQLNQFEKDLAKPDLSHAINSSKGNADIDKKTGKPTNLLWTMQTGAALRFNNEHQESTKYFDLAEQMMKSEDTESLLEKGSESSGSLLGNDAMLDYEQTHYDGIMTNTYKAFNFWQSGDINNARVEFNRADDRQRRAAEYFAKKIRKEKEALAAKKKKQQGSDSEDSEEKSESDAAVASTLESQETKLKLKNAGLDLSQWQAYKGYINPFTSYASGLFSLLTAESQSDYQKAAQSFERVYGVTQSAAVKIDLQMAQALAKGSSSATDFKSAVWIIFENGLSVVKEEKRIDLPLGVLANSNVHYAGMALPKLKNRGKAFDEISVEGFTTVQLADIDKIIGAEFKDQFPAILAREVTRATLKTIAQANIIKNDTTGYAGLIATMAQVLTTGADVRSFTALPSEFQLTRFEKKESTINLKFGEKSYPVLLDENFKNHVIYVKAINKTLTPSISVINI